MDLLELKVTINAMLVCSRGTKNLDVLYVYCGGNCLIERVSSRVGYDDMHVLRHAIEQLVSHYYME